MAIISVVPMLWRLEAMHRTIFTVIGTIEIGIKGKSNFDVEEIRRIKFNTSLEVEMMFGFGRAFVTRYKEGTIRYLSRIIGVSH